MAEAKEIFFNKIRDDVWEELEARENVYGAINKPYGVHQWVTMKSAWAKVITPTLDSSAIRNSPDFSKNITTIGAPLAGGVTNLYDIGANNVPRHPILTDIEVVNEGQLGSPRKVIVKFSVFSRDQLDIYEPLFMKIGKPVKVEFGWNTYIKHSDACKLSFNGVTFNYSYSLRADGGYDCSFDVVGKGYAIMNAVPQITSVEASSGTPIATDAAGTELVMSPIKEIFNKALQSVLPADREKNKLYEKDFDGNWVQFYFFPQDNILSPGAVEGGAELISYITLGTIFSLINKWLTDNVYVNNSGAFYECDAFTTLSHNLGPYVKSANPYEMVIPHKIYGKYSTTEFFDPEEDRVETEGGGVNVSAIAISLNLIYQFIDEIGEEIIKQKANHYFTKASFLDLIDKIFKTISSNTGGIIDLCLIENEVTTNIMVVNKNYMQSSNDIKVFTFHTFNNSKSVIREMSMAANIPGTLATAAYITGLSNVTNVNFPNGGINALISENVPDFTKQKSDRDTILTKLKSDIGHNYLKLVSTPTVGVDNKKEIVGDLRSQLETFKGLSDDDMTSWNTAFPIPLSLSLTIDGINDFRFGDTITTDYLPNSYRHNANYQFVFTVGKVTHSVTPHDWVTKLETFARIIPKTKVP